MLREGRGVSKTFLALQVWFLCSIGQDLPFFQTPGSNLFQAWTNTRDLGGAGEFAQPVSKPNDKKQHSYFHSRGQSGPLTTAPLPKILTAECSVRASVVTQWKAISLIYFFLPGNRADRITKALGLFFFNLYIPLNSSLLRCSQKVSVAKYIWETLNVKCNICNVYWRLWKVLH